MSGRTPLTALVLAVALVGAVGADAGTAVRGALHVTVAGLGHGVPARITVTGPRQSAGTARYRRTLRASTTLRRLVPGVYTVTVRPVTAAGVTYVVPLTRRRVTIVAGATARFSALYHAVGPAP